LNNIIVSFVNSIECKNIKNHHPGVLIELDLQPDLRNIIGSSIHLTKTVMNLISNAAEAINNAGSIRLSTKNLRHQYYMIDGYEKIPVGDYVVLTISDSGSGISSQDMGKIFEPFYTKKKMGRSGTGLGMAVVWGTVKDLKGYIDIKSVLGTGTSISLYFPVTQRKTA
jgi:signal transduction histidine kinase